MSKILFLVMGGASIDSFILYRYGAIMLALVALYHLLYALELKHNAYTYGKEILFAILFIVIALNYLLRSYSIKFLW